MLNKEYITSWHLERDELKRYDFVRSKKLIYEKYSQNEIEKIERFEAINTVKGNIEKLYNAYAANNKAEINRLYAQAGLIDSHDRSELSEFLGTFKYAYDAYDELFYIFMITNNSFRRNFLNIYNFYIGYFKKFKSNAELSFELAQNNNVEDILTEEVFNENDIQNKKINISKIDVKNKTLYGLRNTRNLLLKNNTELYSKCFA